jgi:hypothetical protein
MSRGSLAAPRRRISPAVSAISGFSPLVRGISPREVLLSKGYHMNNRIAVLDIDPEDREALIADVRAVMPTQDDPYFFQDHYDEIAANGPPRFLYHSTDASRREQIAAEGLLLRHSETAQTAEEMGEEEWWTFGGVFFSTVIHDITPMEDVWVLDTAGMPWRTTELGAAADDLVPDFSVDTANWAKDEMWWYVRCDIGPERLRLHELCYPRDEPPGTVPHL